MMTYSPSAFELLTRQISTLPLWIKQVIYHQVRADLEQSMSKTALDTFAEQDLLQMWVPPVTHAGKKELELPNGQGNPSTKQLLYMASFGKSVLHICVHHQWTLEHCTMLLLDAIERQFITLPTSYIMEATIHYLANRIRIGEYLVKIGRVSVEQLDQSLRTQKYIEDALGEKSGLADVLINLGYINRHDSDGILFLKDESKKSLRGLSTEISSTEKSPSATPSSPVNTMELTPVTRAAQTPGSAQPVSPIVATAAAVSGLNTRPFGAQQSAQPEVKRPVWSFK